MNNKFNRISAKARLLNRIISKIPAEYLDKYESSFAIDYAHNSTAIEGNTLSLMETKLLLEDKISIGGKKLREIYEVVNHQKAFDFIKGKIAEGCQLDAQLLKEIHAILVENIFVGGIYRDGPVRITGASFIPPCGEAMYRDLQLFYADFSWMQKKEPIEYAAWTHAEFVRIHPFADGNGRTSRMIMNYQLMSNGLLPISIQANDRYEYYRTLEAYAVNNDIEPFMLFVADHEERALDEYLNLAVSLKIISDLDIKIAVSESHSSQKSKPLSHSKDERTE